MEPTIAEDPDDLARAAAAAAVRRLGHALIASRVPAELARRIAETVEALADETDAAPARRKEVEHARTSRRYQALLEGRLPDPTAHGEEIEFDRFSLVGGELNPFGLIADHRRDGEEAVTTVRFGPAYEGPPGRVHGGAVALVIDEATATVLPMEGRFGFTGTVSLKLRAPAPLGVEVQFRSRLVGEDGRKLFVRCVASGPKGVFAEADAVYVQVDPSTVPWLMAGPTAGEDDDRTDRDDDRVGG
jgi:acyl-coenzyme A thioesterase PaaI-like protein